MALTTYSALLESIDWQEGRTELPGVDSRVYGIHKSDILDWPKLPVDAEGRPTSSTYTGNFTLREGKVFKHFDVNALKSKHTSDPQGEAPSQTQLNKLMLILNSAGEKASNAAVYLNNTDSVFIFRDMSGAFRVVGSKYYPGKVTVAQDGGEGPTGTATTTVNVEATDIVASPFYKGTIPTDDGVINQPATAG